MLSDYIVYADESGDHNLVKTNPDYPIFVLTFCIFRKPDYSHKVVPGLKEIKFKYFGHDAFVLHERDIRKANSPFEFLKDVANRNAFNFDVKLFMSEIPMTIISAVINKKKLTDKYVYPDDPYSIALTFCMERTQSFLEDNGQPDRKTFAIFESRGKKEDRLLELVFRRVSQGGNYKGKYMPLEILFASKQANLAGLQISDLIARPIGRHTLDTTQTNIAYQTIAPKFRKSPSGNPSGWGLKVFP